MDSITSRMIFNTNTDVILTQCTRLDTLTTYIAVDSTNKCTLRIWFAGLRN